MSDDIDRKPPRQHEPFEPVRAQLLVMQTCLAAPAVDLLALAKAYASLARAMLEATRHVGQSSMRFEAVVKALDLRTDKSVLQRFLQA